MNPRASPDRMRVLFALLAVYVIWGSTYFAIRVGLEGYPPFLMGGVRYAIAGAALYATLRLRGAPAPSAVEWKGAAWTGTLLLLGGNGTVCFAEQSVSSSLAAIVVATMPLWAVLFASLAGERSTRLELVGVALGFVGVAVLNAGGALEAHGVYALALLAAPVCWSLGSLASRRVRLPGGAMTTATQMLAGGAAMLVVGVARGEHAVAPFAPRPLAAVVYLIVLGSLVAFRAYGYLLQHTRPATATSYAYVNPVVAVILGVALGGETVRTSSLVGTGIILASLVALSLGKAYVARARKGPAEARPSAGPPALQRLAGATQRKP